MKIQNSVFFNENFTPAFRKLLDFEFDSSITIRVIKTMKILDEQQYAVFLTRDKLLQDTAEHIDGQVVLHDKSVKFKSVEDLEKFKNQFDELMRDEFDIPLNAKIKLNSSHKISASHLEALNSMVEIDDGGV